MLGIYHSDIKTENIVFSNSRKRYLIIDFGVSRSIPDWAEKKSNEVEIAKYSIGGTRSYFSPEKNEYWSKHSTYPNELKGGKSLLFEEMKSEKEALDICHENINYKKDSVPFYFEDSGFLQACSEENKTKLLEDNQTFNPFKDDIWALAICLEKMVGIKAEDYKGNPILQELFTKIKHVDRKLRFDASDLWEFVVKNKLLDIESSGLIEREQELINTLDKIKRKIDGYQQVYFLLEEAGMPQEKLIVALEEFKDVISAQDLNEANSQIGNASFELIPILERLGEI